MTQVSKRKIRPEVIALGVAALVFGTAVGIGLGRKAVGDPPSAVASATMPANSLPRLEEQARERPDDPLIAQALGQAYFDAGQYESAAASYARAVKLQPDRAIVWSALGEAQVMASKTEPMPPAALEAFRKAVALDPNDPRARYFLAVKRDLDGDHQGAITDWLALLADTPQGAPWELDLKRTIEQVGKIAKIDVASRIAAVKQPAPVGGAIAGPSAEDLKNASKIPPSEQRRMAEGMVASLEAKLQANPANVDGWIMLIRSRSTLGEMDKASAALAAAIKANPGAAQNLRAAASGLGVK